MLRKIISIFIIGSIIQILLLVSCSKLDSEINNCGNYPNRFKITGFNLTENKIEKFNSRNYYWGTDSISSNDTVTFDSLSIGLIPIKKEYFAVNKPHGFSFLSESFACRPIPAYCEASIDYILITCDKDYNNSFKAGEDLLSLFDVVIFDAYKEINFYRLSLKDFMALKPNGKDLLFLILNEPPSRNGSYKFAILYWQSSDSYSNEFEMETKEINIKL